jgi:type IV pilus assembly protein PilO
MAIGPKTQRDQIMVVVAVLAALLIIPYWYYAWKPKADTLTVVQEHVDKLDAANQKAKAELAKGNVDQLRAEAAVLTKNLEIIRQLVPTSNEVPSLLEQVSTAARRVNLDLGSVEPEPTVEGEQFDTYRYKISVQGDYHGIAEFLTNVGTLTRIIAPVNLQLAPASGQPSGGKKRTESQLDTKFEIQTYVARTAAPSKPAPAGGSKS